MSNRNATASWSGYLHQGKVGIFVALKLLRENLGENIEDWRIIYENAEDFDIQKKSGENWENPEVISRHQVKAKKEGIFPNDYKNVLTIGHTETFKCQGVPCDQRFLHTIVEIKGLSLSEPSFRKTYPRAIYIENPNGIKAYEYPDSKLYSPLSTDDDFLKKSTLDLIRNCSGVLDSDSAYEALLWELDQEIRVKHNQTPMGFPEISFQRISEILREDNSTTKFEEARLRNGFSNVYEEYKKELQISGIVFDENEKTTDKIIERFYKLGKKDFLQFLKDIHPDVSEFTERKNLNEAGLKDVFLECLLKVRKFSILNHKFSNYLLSTVNRNKAIISHSIITNTNLTNNLFEGSTIINEHIDSLLIEKLLELPNYTRYKNEADSTKVNWELVGKDVDDGNLFLHPKGIALISVDSAITKLNSSES